MGLETGTYINDLVVTNPAWIDRSSVTNLSDVLSWVFFDDFIRWLPPTPGHGPVRIVTRLVALEGCYIQFTVFYECYPFPIR